MATSSRTGLTFLQVAVVLMGASGITLPTYLVSAPSPSGTGAQRKHMIAFFLHLQISPSCPYIIVYKVELLRRNVVPRYNYPLHCIACVECEFRAIRDSEVVSRVRLTSGSLPQAEVAFISAQPDS